MTSLERFQTALKAGESAVIFSPVSRRYLSGFSSSDGSLFITPESARLYLDPRYYEMGCIQKEKGSLPAGLEICPAVFAKDFFAFSQSGRAQQVFFEDRQMTVAELERLKEKFPKAVFVPMGSLLEQMRLIKSPQEIARICAAQKLAEEAYLSVLPKIEAGRTESEIAAELEYFMKLHGASGPSFETVCVGGKRSSLPHGKAEDVPLEKNSFLTMDFGCILDGYSSDMTRTVCIGRADEKMHLVYETVLAAQKAGLAAVAAGIPGKDVDKAARDVIDGAGFGEYFGHSTGHGLGLEVHEAPSFSPKAENLVPAGAVLSVEPGIYLPGEFGVRIEDLVVVRQGGCDNLNTTSKELLEL